MEEEGPKLYESSQLPEHSLLTSKRKILRTSTDRQLLLSLTKRLRLVYWV